ncbi:hypothetical protein ANCDUO_26322, partial [Ancylostoma duodenale]
MPMLDGHSGIQRWRNAAYCTDVMSAISANVAGWAVIYASAAFGDLVRSHLAARALYSIIDSCQEVKKGETPVIQNLSLIVRNEHAVALVGASGYGKSTVIQLLERFYDPDSGNVQLDGNDLRLICRVHLRNNIALVGQEPVLFK